MSEQIDYTWRPDGFPPAEAGWYYPKDGVRMAGDVWINKRHNGEIERGSELHARGFNIGNSVNICSEWVQRRIPAPVAESKGENAAYRAMPQATEAEPDAAADAIASRSATPASEDGVVVGLQSIADMFKRTGDNVFEAVVRAAISRIQSDAAKIKEQGKAIDLEEEEKEDR